MLGTPLGEASIKLGSIKLPLRRMLRHSRHCGYGSVVMEYWIPLGKEVDMPLDNNTKGGVGNQGCNVKGRKPAAETLTTRGAARTGLVGLGLSRGFVVSRSRTAVVDVAGSGRWASVELKQGLRDTEGTQNQTKETEAEKGVAKNDCFKGGYT